ncbi:MAG: TraB/GumN family protein [Dokdonella sp.]
MLCRFLPSLLALIGATAVAQSAPESTLPALATTELPAVVVSGEQPGPGLWKVSQGDHVLWILGTLSPLPKDMAWKSKEVEETIKRSQIVLNPPTLRLHPNVGFFGKLILFPTLIGVRNNRDGATLQQVVPPDLYERWLALKERYIGRSAKVEKWRPIFAALELYKQAIRRSHMTQSDSLGDLVRKTAKRAGIETLTPTVTIEVDNPRVAVKSFKSSELDDLECFRRTLDRIDRDIGTMTARANAWATGDIDTLRKLPDSDQRIACLAAITQTRLAKDLGVVDIEARVREAWLDAATSALTKNVSSFARLPVADLLASDGLLAKLRTLGYVVESPDEVAAESSDLP